MLVRSKIENTLFRKWESLNNKTERPTFFYVISQINTGWGVVVPEIIGVLKHSIRNKYSVYFIADRLSSFKTLELFDIGLHLNIINREKFIRLAELEDISNFFALSIGNSNILKQYCQTDPTINTLFTEVPSFHWPFGDLLRCIIHDTEFVHPDFLLNKSGIAEFERLVSSGISCQDREIKLTIPNINLAKDLLRTHDSPRFVLSVRDAPAFHGLDRNTVPEELDQLLLEASKFTKVVDLIGTSPSKLLRSVINKHSAKIKVIDHTYSDYHSYHSDTDDARPLLQSYLLAAPSIKLLCQNGIIAIPSAAGQLFGIFNSVCIFHPWIHDALVVPRIFSYNTKLSPTKAFLHGLCCFTGKHWALERTLPSQKVVYSAIENLLIQYKSSNPCFIRDQSAYNPRLLNSIRRYLQKSPEIVEHFTLSQFGTHLIQDNEGTPIRFA